MDCSYVDNVTSLISLCIELNHISFKPTIRQEAVNNWIFYNFEFSKEVEFETADGAGRTEQLHFSTLGNFGKQGITRQSTYLNELSHQCEDLQKFVKQLKTNKILRTLLENKEAKTAYLSCIRSLINEMEQTA